MAIQDLLDEFDLGEGIILMNALTSPMTLKKQLRRTVSESWHLDDLAEQYDALIKRFKPLRQSLDKGHSPSPDQAFQARLLLIHDYRRILLRDTPLPEDLLPNRWRGTLARQLVSGLYKDLADASVGYISTQLQSEQGRCRHLPADFSNDLMTNTRSVTDNERRITMKTVCKIMLLPLLSITPAQACTKLMWATPEHGVFIARSDFDFPTKPTID